MKISDKDKVNHYINNLAQASIWNDKLKPLKDKVEQVKNDVSFVIFCQHHHDNWRVDINVLNDYFIINS